MNTLPFLTTAAAAVLAMGVAAAGFAQDTGPVLGKCDEAGNSNKGHVILVQKNVSGDWSRLEDGGYGKMTYNLSGDKFKFVMNGHELDPGREYTLIYYPDPWPGHDLLCLGNGMAGELGDLHIKGAIPTGDLPAPYDENYPDAGAKIWLVPTDDVNCFPADPPQMNKWNPAPVLYEQCLIFYSDTSE